VESAYWALLSRICVDSDLSTLTESRLGDSKQSVVRICKHDGGRKVGNRTQVLLRFDLGDC